MLTGKRLDGHVVGNMQHRHGDTRISTMRAEPKNVLKEASGLRMLVLALDRIAACCSSDGHLVEESSSVILESAVDNSVGNRRMQVSDVFLPLHLDRFTLSFIVSERQTEADVKQEPSRSVERLLDVSYVPYSSGICARLGVQVTAVDFLQGLYLHLFNIARHDLKLSLVIKGSVTQ